MSLAITPYMATTKHGAYGEKNCGYAIQFFGASFSNLRVGQSQGPDARRETTNWWPVTLAGQRVGELRENADGLALHIGDTDRSVADPQPTIYCPSTILGRPSEAQRPLSSPRSAAQIFAAKKDEIDRLLTSIRQAAEHDFFVNAKKLTWEDVGNLDMIQQHLREAERFALLAER